eukprot:CAMPEP_0179056628 /NCGR_PEP_ID=MMETSP0796-20121207/23909_1 /TAXON_ID=73915 /ORGANISM="Pyrodinium bahamense, Strain pbaha01" /LENGTH=167 /DNA_ID=CAMNT_0020753307 /DNA_START=635 /DNA_END=1139 /DNA_ORIENTATION=+
MTPQDGRQDGVTQVAWKSALPRVAHFSVPVVHVVAALARPRALAGVPASGRHLAAPEDERLHRLRFLLGSLRRSIAATAGELSVRRGAGCSRAAATHWPVHGQPLKAPACARLVAARGARAAPTGASVSSSGASAAASLPPLASFPYGEARAAAEPQPRTGPYMASP